MQPTILDLTSGFTELGFRGAVTIAEAGSRCTYSFEGFRVAFVTPTDARFTKIIQLSHFSMSIHGFRGSPMQRDDRPFDVMLSRDGVTSATFSGMFSLDKQSVLDAEYLTFGVYGVRFMEVHDDDMKKVTGPRRTDRCVWPISAGSNRIVDEPARRFAPPRYRQPPDPNDCCAPERIR